MDRWTHVRQLKNRCQIHKLSQVGALGFELLLQPAPGIYPLRPPRQYHVRHQFHQHQSHLHLRLLHSLSLSLSPRCCHSLSLSPLKCHKTHSSLQANSFFFFFQTFRRPRGVQLQEVAPAAPRDL